MENTAMGFCTLDLMITSLLAQPLDQEPHPLNIIILIQIRIEPGS